MPLSMMRANSEPGRLSGDVAVQAHGYRRLREDPYTAVQRIAGEIGPRAATSVAEAKAAAYLDSRLRRAGLLLSADTFRVGARGRDGLILGALGLAAAILWHWQPIPSLLLALWSVGLAASLARPGRASLFPAGGRSSQNVVATRASAGRARWRVVLLAPLDSPPVLGRLERGLLSLPVLRYGRVAACTLLFALGLVGMLAPLGLPAGLARAAGFAQLAPAAYLLLSAAVEALAGRRAHSPGAVSHAGALAALLAAAEVTESLQGIELWAVGLGATSLGAGMADLLRRYPFDPEATLFVCLEGVGGGSPCFVSGGDAPGARGADPLLLSVAHAVGAEPHHEAGPRIFRGGWTQAGLLRAAGLRTLAITSLDADGRVPRQGSADDSAEAVDPALLEHTAQLVSEIVRRLDATSA